MKKFARADERNPLLKIGNWALKVHWDLGFEPWDFPREHSFPKTFWYNAPHGSLFRPSDGARHGWLHTR
jgi:hypothetical protein